MKIKNMFFGKRKGNHEEFPEFDAEVYKNIAESSDFCEDKPVSDSARIGLVCIEQNGVFVFVLSRSEDEPMILQDVATAQRKYYLNTNGVYIFVRTNEKDYFYCGGKITEIDSILEGFENLYNNTKRPAIDLNYIGFESDLDMLKEPELPDAYKDEHGNPIEVEFTGEVSYVAPRISEKMLQVIAKKFDEAKEDASGKEEYVDENGVRYRKHYSTIAKGMWVAQEQWYPVADDDPVKFFLLALFGGMFGLHKFKSKEYGKGLFYLLTCGGFGVFYVSDIISMVLGNYYVTQVSYSETGNGLEKYKQRIYLDKLPKLSYRFVGALSSILIAYIAFTMVYVPTLTYFSNLATNSIVSSFEQNAGNYLENLEN